MRLVYSACAVADLARLRAFIAENDPAAAPRVARELVDRMEHLRTFPQMGRNVDTAPEPGAIRDFAFGRYMVRYVARMEYYAFGMSWNAWSPVDRDKRRSGPCF